METYSWCTSAADLPKVYIDEKAGSDSEGTGSELSPFASPLAAYQSLNPPPAADANPSSIAQLLIRKPDSVERNEWIELSASAKKRLIKNIETWRKKEVKAAQSAEKVAAEKKEADARDALRRQEAAGVVLVDDESKGKAVKVRLIEPPPSPPPAAQVIMSMLTISRPRFTNFLTLSVNVSGFKLGFTGIDHNPSTTSWSCGMGQPTLKWS